MSGGLEMLQNFLPRKMIMVLLDSITDEGMDDKLFICFFHHKYSVEQHEEYSMILSEI